MNKTLSALMTKLNWQLTDLNLQLQRVEQTIKELESQLNASQSRINNASTKSGCIIPEREIAGLHFIMVQQQEQDELKANSTEHHAQREKLIARKKRLETELKMLEKYQNNQQESLRKKQLVMEQNRLDEWVIQGALPLR